MGPEPPTPSLARRRRDRALGVKATRITTRPTVSRPRPPGARGDLQYGRRRAEHGAGRPEAAARRRRHRHGGNDEAAVPPSRRCARRLAWPGRGGRRRPRRRGAGTVRRRHDPAGHDRGGPRGEPGTLRVGAGGVTPARGTPVPLPHPQVGTRGALRGARRPRRGPFGGPGGDPPVAAVHVTDHGPARRGRPDPGAPGVPALDRPFPEHGGVPTPGDAHRAYARPYGAGRERRLHKPGDRGAAGARAGHRRPQRRPQPRRAPLGHGRSRREARGSQHGQAPCLRGCAGVAASRLLLLPRPSDGAPGVRPSSLPPLSRPPRVRGRDARGEPRPARAVAVAAGQPRRALAGEPPGHPAPGGSGGVWSQGEPASRLHARHGAGGAVRRSSVRGVYRDVLGPHRRARGAEGRDSSSHGRPREPPRDPPPGMGAGAPFQPGSPRPCGSRLRRSRVGGRRDLLGA